MTNKLLISIFCLLLSLSALAQKDKKKIEEKKAEDKKEQTKQNVEGLVIVPADSALVRKEIDPLRPSKAAFYSAILPGLGQAYNKKYWKIPLVYAALGTGVYFYIDNNKQYKRVRDAYKRRLAGFEDDEFQDRLTDDGLREAQKSLRRNKELSLLVTIGLYALNIIDANVDAHLLQYNVDENLSFKPHYKIDEFDKKGTVGLTMSFKLD
ncbi:DUF5683 domain-containing protein [Lacinutrix sp. Bg11-31]|uniref:DUF5683 domain-containing protein n=1 Tax=Lacinutrix sp. Bg11-31 TaxID=2057808 RepID=UPI000C2FF3D8|nr:DUF5683 domain-containing protein [Lacinutrix sp. Bg11-31]AUC80885.1 hypothetical protein CW733_01530 [Lacinutrix sp. Bg11-31]